MIAGQWAFRGVCIGRRVGALHGQLVVPVCVAVRGVVRHRGCLCEHHGRRRQWNFLILCSDSDSGDAGLRSLLMDFFCAGTTMNYFLDDRINRAEVLFPGVGCFLIAVWLGAWLHKSNTDDNLAKLQTHSK